MEFSEAFRELRARAEAGLTPDLTMEETDEEIRQARAERKTRKAK